MGAWMHVCTRMLSHTLPCTAQRAGDAAAGRAPAACATCDAHQGHHQEDPIDLTQDQIDLTHDEDGSLNNPIDLSDDIKHNTHTDTSVTCYLCKDGRKDNHEEDERTSPQPNVTTWAQNQHDNGQVSCLQAEGQRRADQRSAFSTTEQTWC